MSSRLGGELLLRTSRRRQSATASVPSRISELKFGAHRRPKLDLAPLGEPRGRSGEFRRILEIPIFRRFSGSYWRFSGDFRWFSGNRRLRRLLVGKGSCWVPSEPARRARLIYGLNMVDGVGGSPENGQNSGRPWWLLDPAGHGGNGLRSGQEASLGGRRC